ncbi:uncharacterized protein N7484_006160 [Penicillium longicatenatum]|uniref:uncharacterized protein n=1 Tax=Penicillium longicatenatum TaxID=1561947 RepID=UPI002546ECC0|nr:uncharacterized protein N7484_006160 [Penicillium longicatenatum]KAJ5643653.1 hypothetical protein N7484_006160 [Penicillium longicatenatum]
MKSMGIARVVESRNPDIVTGSLVTGIPWWSEYSIDDATNVSVLNPQPGLLDTHFLGALGLPGFTVYYALTQIVKAKSTDAIVVSGAAGAVGNMVVQIAKKMIGCRKVIGIAGTDEKCRWVEKLGADICLNYKSPSFKQNLTHETEGFVEIYFGELSLNLVLEMKESTLADLLSDNVGGDILDFMLSRLAKFGRVAASGTISDYNRDSDTTGLKNFYPYIQQIITMRLQILGFINIDWIEHLPEVRALLVDEWKKGNLIIGDENEMVIDTDFEDIPRTWMMLYSGGNTGKLVTKLKH